MSSAGKLLLLVPRRERTANCQWNSKLASAKFGTLIKLVALEAVSTGRGETAALSAAVSPAVCRLDVYTGFPALFRGDRGRRSGQWVEATAGLRERDHFTERILAGKQHRDSIPAEGDTAVRRRAVGERVQQEAEFLPGLSSAEIPITSKTRSWMSAR